MARHGTYSRSPSGTHIARWYCPESHTTFSALPDCLPARLPGTLVELEDVVAVAEQAVSLEAAANQLRPDPVLLPGALRWLRRRVQRVHRCLILVIGLLPAQLARCEPRILSVRARLGSDTALMVLRAAAIPLQVLPPPLGFSPPPHRPAQPIIANQQRTGPDPPPAGP